MPFHKSISDFFFGDDPPEIPALTPAQQKNLDLQNKMLSEQSDLSRLLLPIILGEDFDVTVDENGKVTGLTPKAPGPGEAAQDEIQGLLAERSLQFLRGEGAVPEQVNRQFADSKRILEESLRKSLGPDFISSTPGFEAIADFESERLATLESIRFGELSSTEGMRLAGQTAQEQTSNQNIQRLLAGLGVQSNPLAGLQTAQQLAQSRQELGLKASIAGHRPGLIQSMAGGVGQGIGAAGITSFLSPTPVPVR
jgi:hypothetical protein